MQKPELRIYGGKSDDGSERVLMHVAEGSVIIDGTGSMAALEMLMHNHGDKAKAEPILFLFFARQWFDGRGYHTRFTVDSDEPWIWRMWMKAIEKVCTWRLRWAPSIDAAFGL